jgi:hypothetical protein
MYYNVLHRKQLYQGRILDTPIAAFWIDFIAAYLPFIQTVMGRPYPFAVIGIHVWDVDVAGSNPVTPTIDFDVKSQI